MPSKIKPRSPSGITNKSSASHSRQCICQTCNCGNHSCSEKKKHGESVATEKLPLEGGSETKQQFITREIPDRKNVYNHQMCLFGLL